VDGEAPPNTAAAPKTERRDVPDEAYFDGRIAAKANEALRQLKAREEPFFLAVGFWKPHLPFNPPARYWDSIGARTSRCRPTRTRPRACRTWRCMTGGNCFAGWAGS
jgi:hypothetical protein